MNSMDNQQLLDDDNQALLEKRQYARVGKKTYRKPSVQVYGTLSQITQAQANPGAHILDGGGGPPVPSQQSNRT